MDEPVSAAGYCSTEPTQVHRSPLAYPAGWHGGFVTINNEEMWK